VSALPASLAANPRLDGWIGVDAGGTVTIRTGKVELGQGVVSAIASIAGVELGLRFEQIRVVSGDTVDAPDEGLTAGSLSVEQGGAAMRWASALVRALFAEAAAQALGVPVETLAVEEGAFFQKGRNESRTYWDLRDAVDLSRSALDLQPPLLRGGSLDGAMQRLDLPDKFAGAAFIHDMMLPGMLYGRIARPPHPAARLVSIDRAALEALPGIVKLVVDGSFIGVVAERDEQAAGAVILAATKTTWSRDAELPAASEANEWMLAWPLADETIFDEAPAPPEHVALRHAALYSRPYLAHASIGPACAVADWKDGNLTVYTHSQGVFPLRRELAKALGMDADRIHVIHRLGAGCYGHNGADDVALDAVLLARASGAPVMCQWSRSDELSWAPFGAAMRIALSAGVTAEGRIVEWTHDVWTPPHVTRPGPGEGLALLAAWHLERPHDRAPPLSVGQPSGAGDRNAVPLYDVGARHIVHHKLAHGPVRSSALRSLGAHGNVFAIESFIDEIAEMTGQDPVEIRLRHLTDPRARAVVETAARLAQWDPAAPGGEARGRGIGFARYKNFGGFCAVVAHVEINEKINLVEIFAAVDCGEVVHRDGLINQIEGGIIQAASWTLKEAVRWTDKELLMRNWEDYPILKFSEVPRIEIAVLAPEGAEPRGAGECAAGPTAAAIGNAVAHGLGLRMRHMPFTPERIIEAINAS